MYVNLFIIYIFSATNNTKDKLPNSYNKKVVISFSVSFTRVAQALLLVKTADRTTSPHVAADHIFTLIQIEPRIRILYTCLAVSGAVALPTPA